MKMLAPIWRSDDYYRLLARHGSTPEEIEALRAQTIPEHNHVERQVVQERPVVCGEAIAALFERATTRPPLKALTDAMRADGFPETAIHRARNAQAKRRATSEKRQAEFEKLFGKYNARSTPAVKKVLKAVKKR
jgi:hypothetical protein